MTTPQTAQPSGLACAREEAISLPQEGTSVLPSRSGHTDSHALYSVPWGHFSQLDPDGISPYAESYDFL